jgi:RNA polymerase sigma-70 factor (ECF subfamily)
MAYNYRVAAVEAPEPAPPTDDELVAATLAGDETAFAELFNRHRRMVAGIGGRFFRRREQIEEIIQVSFCRAYLALIQFEGGQERSFVAWLKRIAVNTCLDELRRIGRRKESLLSEFDDGEAEFLHDRLHNGSGEPGVERRTINRDLADKLLSRLRPEDRLALTLLYEEQWSVAEIGEFLGWTIGKVKMRAYSARKSLRSILEKLR